MKSTSTLLEALLFFLKTTLGLGLCFAAAFAADLRNAVILVPRGAPSPERKAAQMLTEEIFKRTQIRLEVTDAALPAGQP